MSGSTVFRRRLVLLAVLTFVAGVAYAVYALRIDEIRVSGLRTLDPKMVIERSGLKGGERILWVRLSAVARRLEAIPGIATARAER
ncbi:MAG: cell division protein FtsQ/DivIB, partial [Actinomycetota bacterium]